MNPHSNVAIHFLQNQPTAPPLICIGKHGYVNFFLELDVQSLCSRPNGTRTGLATRITKCERITGSTERVPTCIYELGSIMVNAIEGGPLKPIGFKICIDLMENMALWTFRSMQDNVGEDISTAHFVRGFPKCLKTTSITSLGVTLDEISTDTLSASALSIREVVSHDENSKNLRTFVSHLLQFLRYKSYQNADGYLIKTPPFNFMKDLTILHQHLANACIYTTTARTHFLQRATHGTFMTTANGTADYASGGNAKVVGKMVKTAFANGIEDAILKKEVIDHLKDEEQSLENLAEKLE